MLSVLRERVPQTWAGRMYPRRTFVNVLEFAHRPSMIDLISWVITLPKISALTQHDWMRRRTSWRFDGLGSRPATALLPITASVHAARLGLEEMSGFLARVASATLRSTRWRILRARLILLTIWDSVSGSCSNTAARQSVRQFSDSSVKREFIKTPHNNGFHSSRSAGKLILLQHDIVGTLNHRTGPFVACSAALGS